MIISKLNLKIIALNRFSEEVIGYAQRELKDISKLKGCALTHDELKALFLKAQEEDPTRSPDRIVTEIRRWVFDLGMPEAFF